MAFNDSVSGTNASFPSSLVHFQVFFGLLGAKNERIIDVYRYSSIFPCLRPAQSRRLEGVSLSNDKKYMSKGCAEDEIRD